MIPKEFIINLVSNANITDIISRYTSLKKQGHNLVGLCPFHSEKSPSFVVYSDTNSFYCFGCGVGGDVLSFIMQAENLNYVDGIHELAKRTGYTVPQDDDGENIRLRTRILEINKLTARFYFDALINDPLKVGLIYLKNRGLSDKIIKKYGLGYAPNSFDNLKNYLFQKGYNIAEMIAANVVSEGKKNSVYDRFRHRIMFPIIDMRGNIIGFGGRVLDDSKPKYLNTSDTLVFKKSRNLFSLNFAKNVDKLILTEGYMDVIAISNAGFDNAVATLGTAITTDQARLIAKYAKEVIIAYDSDEAGQKATHRAINILSEVSVETRILIMNDAKDPDEYIKKFGAKRFSMLIENSANIIEHELKVLRQKYDITDPSQKIEYLKRSVAVISDIKNPIEREVYAGIIAKDTNSQVETILTQALILYKKKLKEQDLQEWRQVAQHKTTINDQIDKEKAENLKVALLEENIIVILCKKIEYKDYILSKIAIDDFITEFNKRVITAVINCINNYNNFTFSVAFTDFSSDEKSKISGILARCSATITKELLDDLLIKLKESKTPKVSTLSVDDIEEFRKQRKNGKG